MNWEDIYSWWKYSCERFEFDFESLPIKYTRIDSLNPFIYFYTDKEWQNLQKHYESFPNTQGFQMFKKSSGIDCTAYELFQNSIHFELIAATYILATLQNIFGTRNKNPNFYGYPMKVKEDIDNEIYKYFGSYPATWHYACTTVYPICLPYRYYRLDKVSKDGIIRALIEMSVIEAKLNMTTYSISFHGDTSRSPNFLFNYKKKQHPKLFPKEKKEGKIINLVGDRMIRNDIY